MPLAVIEAILVLSPDGISTACLEWEWIEEEIQWKNQRGERPEENWKRHFSPLIREIRDIVQKARLAVTQNVNSILVVTNFEIGRRIVEHEQQGEPKAGYGKQTIQELSHQLTEEFGRGFSKRNLEYMRRFYLEYCGSAPRQCRVSQIRSFLPGNQLRKHCLRNSPPGLLSAGPTTSS